MRVLKDAVKDMEEMIKMKEESNKLLTSSLDSNPNNANNHLTSVIQFMSSEIINMRRKYSDMTKKFMRLDLTQNYLSVFRSEISGLLDKTRFDYTEKLEKLQEENSKLKKTLATLEDKKKVTISEGKRRVLFTDPDEAFVILSSSNDNLKREINQLKGEISLLKKFKEDTTNENLHLKAELFRLGRLVNAQFYGSYKQRIVKDKELRDNDSMINDFQSSVSYDTNMNISVINNKHKNAEEKEDEKLYPIFKLDLDGFPGVVPEHRKNMLNQAPSENILITNNINNNNNIPYNSYVRLVRNYHRVIYHNRLLIEAHKKSHEMIKSYKEERRATNNKDGSGKNGSKQNRRMISSVDRKLSQVGKRSHKTIYHRRSHEEKTSTLSFPESKVYLKNVSVNMKNYFDKIIQRIISPCSFIRIDERDIPVLTVNICRSVSCHL